MELPSGNVVYVRPIKFKDLRKVVGLFGEVIKELSRADGVPDFPGLVERNWDQVQELFLASVRNGEADLELVQGFEDPVVLLQKIMEVNGGPNLLKRLSEMMGGTAMGLANLVAGAGPEGNQAPN